MTAWKLAIVFIVLTLIFLALYFFRTKLPASLQQSPKTWEITFLYNSQDRTLSLKKITTLDKTIRPDLRTAANSPYKLSVLDKSNKTLFLSKIHITEDLTNGIWTGYPSASASSYPSRPTSLETTIFIPFFENGSKIQIERAGKVILSTDVKQKSGYLWIPEVFAQSSSSQGPIKVVIMGDSFSTPAQFQQYVPTLLSAFQAAIPYSGLNPPIFEFINKDTQINLGCAFAPGPWQGYCTEANIKRAGYIASPTAAKFIVLANNNLSAAPPLAETNDIGGDIVLLGINQSPGVTFTKAAIHEFLGHAVGELYDRYATNIDRGIKYGIRSNCTDNPSGEAFWRQAGANGPYPLGCDSRGLYAPYPNDCPAPPPSPGYRGPIVTTLGNRSSIMSSIGSCAGNEFDPVEQAWIRTQIIPRYQAPPTPPPPPPPPPPGPTPPPAQLNDCSFSLNSGQIVRGDVSTQVFAQRENPNYYLSLTLINSKIGDIVGGVIQGSSLTTSWNSLNLYQNGPATLRCSITNVAIGGSSIFQKDLTINVQN